jgi:hypothetical protein
MAAFALQTRRAIREDPDSQLNYLENDCSTNLALDLLDEPQLVEPQLDEAQRGLHREIPAPTERVRPIVSISLLREIQSLVPYTSLLTPYSNYFDSDEEGEIRGTARQAAGSYFVSKL